MRRLAGVLGIVVVLGGLAACGGGGSKTASSTASSSSSSSSAASSSQSCVDRMIAMLNALDVSNVDPSDGIDSDETTNIEDQIKELTKNDPDIAEGGRCQDEFDALPTNEQNASLARIRPEVVRVLIGAGTNATSKFSSVANSIN